MSFFIYKKRVPFYDTDAMGVVHHSNYIRYFEECRVAWYNEKNLETIPWPHGDKVVMAVLNADAQYKAPARFNDVIEVRMQTRLEGNSRIQFRYAIFSGDGEKLLCTGSTLHIPVNQLLKVIRPPEALIKVVKEEVWTETWP